MIYKGQMGMPILDKVEQTLDILFKVIGQRRVSRAFEIEVSSESDYASDE